MRSLSLIWVFVIALLLFNHSFSLEIQYIFRINVFYESNTWL